MSEEIPFRYVAARVAKVVLGIAIYLGWQWMSHRFDPPQVQPIPTSSDSFLPAIPFEVGSLEPTEPDCQPEDCQPQDCQPDDCQPADCGPVDCQPVE